MMDIAELIARLEAEWGMEGFLGRLRQGQFDFRKGQEFVAMLLDIELTEETLIPKRLLSLLWYLPSFLTWQTERIVENGGEREVYVRFVTEVRNTLRCDLESRRREHV